MSELALSPEARIDYHIPIVGTFPGMNPDLLEAFAPNGTDALVLESNAHAALATDLHATIRTITDRGTAVFVLTDNYIDHRRGVTDIADEPQVGTLASDAFYLETLGRETINDPHNPNTESIGNLGKVIDAIKVGIDEGLKGKDLGEKVSQQFRFSPGQKPVREISVEVLRRHQASLIAQGLGGLGLTDADGNFVGEETQVK